MSRRVVSSVVVSGVLAFMAWFGGYNTMQAFDDRKFELRCEADGGVALHDMQRRRLCFKNGEFITSKEAGAEK